DGIELRAGGSQQRGFARAGWAGEQRQVRGPNVEHHVVGDRVGWFVYIEAEQVGDLAGRETSRAWAERVADGDGVHDSPSQSEGVEVDSRGFEPRMGLGMIRYDPKNLWHLLSSLQ